MTEIIDSKDECEHIEVVAFLQSVSGVAELDLSNKIHSETIGNDY